MFVRAALVVLVVLTALAVVHCEVAVIMKDVTLGFGEALQHCREEAELTEDMMEEFFHFWREDFEFKHRAIGCAILCMSKYFDLLTDSHRMHHDNMHSFIKGFPDGERLSHLMVEIIHSCEKQFDQETDHCLRVLRVAECFKAACLQKGVAPTMEMVMAEFIMETDQ